MSRKLSKRAADQLWSTLREAFARIEETLPKIIEQRAWEPLGYATFEEAWADRMAGVRLTTDTARALVAYALIDDGADDEKVADSVGTTIAKASALRKVKALGVSPEVGAHEVRRHTRTNPKPSDTLHVRLTPDEVVDFKALAKSRGLDIEKESAKALRAHFYAMGVR